MAGSLGSVSFEILADDTQLTAAFVHAKAQAQQASQAIQAAAKAQAAVIAATSEAQKQALSKVAVAATQTAQGVAQAAQQAAQRYQAMASAAQQASQSVQRSAAQMTQSHQGIAAGFEGSRKSALEFGAAVVGVQAGVEGLRRVIEGIAEATQEQAQAQFAVNKLYGATAPLVTQQAEALAKISGRSKTEALEAAASVATLGRNYALTGAQVQQVLKISADLAAVRGISLEAAAERTQSALRGEAEAIEYLGQALGSNALKAMGDMTDAQRKQFDSLSDISKAQIVLANLTKNTADLQGAAADRANSATGAWDKMKASATDLGAEIGKALTPTFVEMAISLAHVADGARDVAGAMGQLNSIKAPDWMPSPGQAGLSTVGGVSVFERIFGRKWGEAPPGEVLVGPGGKWIDTDAAQAAARAAAEHPVLPGGLVGPVMSPEGAQAVADAQALAKQAAAAERDRQKAIAEVRKRARDLEAQAGIAMAEEEHDRGVKDVERRRVLAETEKDDRIRALDAGHKKAMSDLADEQRAAEAANKADIERATQERDAQVAAAEAARRALDDAIKARTEALKHEREIQDRERQDGRAREDRDLEDARRKEDREREDALERARRAEQARHDQIEKDLEGEGDAAEKSHEKATRALERRSQKEDERHRKAVDALKDEEDSRTKVLDLQLKALDAEERQADAAGRVAGLQKNLADAQQALTRAQGTGTPGQIAAARGDLTRALRVGNEVSVANARERLQQLAGQGAVAIKKAQEDLAAVQSDIQKETTKEAHDAERERLTAAKDAIKEEINARQAAEDEKARSRKADIDDDKRAEDEKYKNVKAALDRRKKDEQELHNRNVELAQDEANKQKQALDDERRYADRVRADTREKEDRERADLREKEDGELQHRREEGDRALEADRKAIEQHWDGPSGVITYLKKKTDDIRLEYQQRSEDLRNAHEADKQTIQDFYRNAAKTGVLDKLDAEKDYLGTTLDQEKARWEQHRKDLTGDDGVVTNTFKDIKSQFDSLLQHFKDSGGIVVTASGGITSTPEPGQGDDSGAHGPGPRVGEGADTVPDPYQVQFPFGARYSDPFSADIPIHRGVDVTVKGAANGGKGSPVSAFEDGEVVYNAYDQNGGNGIIIRGEDGLYHRYFHFDSTDVGVGDRSTAAT
jgi:murein DD-endopeptidase MepM/ murein hydrolase activator NlpD